MCVYCNPKAVCNGRLGMNSTVFTSIPSGIQNRWDSDNSVSSVKGVSRNLGMLRSLGVNARLYVQEGGGMASHDVWSYPASRP